MESVRISVEELMKKAKRDFEHDFSRLREMHRFPEGLRGVGKRYVDPLVVAIGPYHHASDDLKKMEKVKAAAAYEFKKGWRPEEPPTEVFSVAGRARKHYAADAVVGMGDPDFEAMMFIDACFLLQYMDSYLYFESNKDYHVDELLRTFFFSRRDCINNDIMLLENQLPWDVVQTIIDSLRDKREYYMNVVAMFIKRMGDTFSICEEDDQRHQTKPFVWPNSPPHLLGLLRIHKIEVGGEDGSQVKWPKIKRISASSAIELAEIGIKLTASKKEVFTDMDVKKRCPFGELSVAPLSLNNTRACWLVNMAAFEVSTASSFHNDPPNSTAVCSYLALLSMFMLRKEDVQELRSKCILHGHHTNAEMLTFFKSVVSHLPDTGCRFAHIMALIELYKKERWLRNKVHKLVYNNFRTIIKVLTIVGTLVGIFQALLSINQG